MKLIATLGRIKEEDSTHYSAFECPECGNEIVRQTSNGKRQHTCGCQGGTAYRLNGHGEVGTELYRKWVNMLSRCKNPNSSQYPWYGAKGIMVDPDWNDYVVFSEWARSSGYRDNVRLALSRLDHDGNYTPLNCYFTPIEDNCREAQERRWKTELDNI